MKGEEIIKISKEILDQKSNTQYQLRLIEAISGIPTNERDLVLKLVLKIRSKNEDLIFIISTILHISNDDRENVVSHKLAFLTKQSDDFFPRSYYDSTYFIESI